MSKYRNYVLVLNDHKTWSHLDGAKIIALSDDERDALVEDSKPIDKAFCNPAIAKDVIQDILRTRGHVDNSRGSSGGSLVTFSQTSVASEPNEHSFDGRPSWTLTQQR